MTGFRFLLGAVPHHNHHHAKVSLSHTTGISDLECVADLLVLVSHNNYWRCCNTETTFNVTLSLKCLEVPPVKLSTSVSIEGESNTPSGWAVIIDVLCKINPGQLRYWERWTGRHALLLCMVRGSKLELTVPNVISTYPGLYLVIFLKNVSILTNSIICIFWKTIIVLIFVGTVGHVFTHYNEI